MTDCIQAPFEWTLSKTIKTYKWPKNWIFLNLKITRNVLVLKKRGHRPVCPTLATLLCKIAGFYNSLSVFITIKKLFTYCMQLNEGKSLKKTCCCVSASFDIKILIMLFYNHKS